MEDKQRNTFKVGCGRRYLPEILIFTVACIVLVLFAHNSPIWYDDACHFLVVKSLATSGKEAFDSNRLSLFITVGPAVNYPCSWFMKIFGISMFNARLFMVLYSMFCLLSIYFLAKHTYYDTSNAKNNAIGSVILTFFTVQYSTYGSQVLGEIPAMTWMIWGVYLIEKQIIAASVCLALAVLCKEYMLAPVAVILLVYSWKYNVRYAIFTGITVLTIVSVYYFFRFDSPNQIKIYWSEKIGYQNEFLNFGFNESIRFLAFKPLILLGTVALIVRGPIMLLGLHLSLLFLFIVSAGFDRFGLWLIPGAAIGISPFVRYAFSIKPIATFFLCVFLFIQKTPYMLIKYIFEEQNRTERLVANYLKEKKVFTYELPLALFIENTRLPKYPPAISEKEPPPVLEDGEYFIVGPYAKTEYPNFNIRKEWKFIFRSGPYEIYQFNSQNYCI